MERAAETLAAVAAVMARDRGRNPLVALALLVAVECVAADLERLARRRGRRRGTCPVR